MSASGKRAVFFDRDGVLNHSVVREGKPYPPASLDELRIMESAPELLGALRDCGYLLIGATNQPDVARGTQTREAVEAINQRLMEALPLLEILVCCHDNRDQCDCRKPQPGMLLRAAARHGIDLSRSFIIGDRWRDIEAGRRAGCCTIWIDYNYKETWPVAAPDFTVCSLTEAVKLIPIENRS